jgi:hypothetical protein
MFLKSNLGSGFTLTVTKVGGLMVDINTQCYYLQESGTSTQNIVDLVAKHIASSKLKNENSLEIIMELDIPNAQVTCCHILISNN